MDRQTQLEALLRQYMASQPNRGAVSDAEMRPMANGFSRGLLRLYLDTTVIGCPSKYGLILREAIRIACNSFCIMGYHSRASHSTAVVSQDPRGEPAPAHMPPESRRNTIEEDPPPSSSTAVSLPSPRKRSWTWSGV